MNKMKFIVFYIVLNFVLYNEAFIELEPDIESFIELEPDIESFIEDKGYDDPLFLTPYIERGDINEGQAAALVKPLYGNIISYSGFLTVNKKHKANLFFWFFPAEIDNNTAPIIMWLQGGPGTSAMRGLFVEHGPYYISKKLKINLREHYWTKQMNVIYIDNPIGAGFSFAKNFLGYSRNEEQIGENLYSATVQFFQLFPQYKQNDFFISGQSYGGKFAPSLAYTIDKYNMNLSPDSKNFINLKGIAIGNGFCDPINMLNYSNYFYEIGIIDKKTKLEMDGMEEKLISAIKGGHYVQEAKILLEIYNLFRKKTGFKFTHNYLYAKKPNLYGNLKKFFTNSTIRNAIHVGNTKYHHTNAAVKLFLSLDYMKSVKPWIEILIEKYKFLIYSGQVDLLVPYPATENFLQNLNWTSAEEYKNADRKLWYVDNELAGYIKTVGKLTEVLVRNAGHIVPSDQPKWALDLTYRFSFGLL